MADKLERMMLAFGLDGTVAVMYVDGEVLERYEDGDPRWLVGEARLFVTSDQCDDVDSKEGIWIWEGRVKDVSDGDAVWNGKWRRPTTCELAVTCIGEGCHPWRLHDD